ncbi:MAG: hypothetical protein QME62_08290 [Armatimonadota bacterium]|nr:hypothetical protein [Armatimonadota bacterium]
MRSVLLITVVLVFLFLIAGIASGDRLILIPTGSTISTGLKAEYAASTEGDGQKIYWASLGVSRFEVEGARFQDFDNIDQKDAVSVQLCVIPETSFTPAVGIGVRDLSDETEGFGLPYDGQSFYAAVSKTVPVTGGIPVIFQDMKVHGGIGTGSLGGVFFGVEGTLPMGLRIAAEYDTEKFNWAAIYNIAGPLKFKVSSIRNDIYYGAFLSTSF